MLTETKKRTAILKKGEKVKSYAPEIVSMLNDLKRIGIDRFEVADGLECNKAYIDQVIAKGGNRSFTARLREYHTRRIVDPQKKIKYSREELAIGMSATIRAIMCRLAKVESLLTKEPEESILKSIELEALRYSTQLLAGDGM